MTGREPPLYAIPPGPAWLRPGTVTYINMAYSQTIVSATIDAGFLLAVDRSDNGKVREAIMRLIDVMLRHHIASVVAKEDAAKKAADNSWAMLRFGDAASIVRQALNLSDRRVPQGQVAISGVSRRSSPFAMSFFFACARKTRLN